MTVRQYNQTTLESSSTASKSEEKTDAMRTRFSPCRVILAQESLACIHRKYAAFVLNTSSNPKAGLDSVNGIEGRASTCKFIPSSGKPVSFVAIQFQVITKMAIAETAET
mmetsp:Transcript_29102/g.61913  ORF Transcript_29102/g.61913 Transcript_29102/m.61913 type:complete len:110 (+) Transcript_29102:534-863(+)